ncbi:MBL fold metallo-hydrolase [Sphingobacterium sp. Ka21]|uniref:MBL fold metallo-hydrolase n=2 Tax=Sphingobacterium pedocola TaxID=2082722 RepID=A0ABR9TBR3_9SPHI|nr:MBL fold metallo-hydrolase [Sphingobacterium pedocola]
MTSFHSNTGKEVRDDLYYYTNQIVNIIMIGDPTTSNWVLVDTGMPKCGDEILSLAYDRFGVGHEPSAIILTHGHFDHVGNVVHLLEHWDVPVFAHTLELSYLTGSKDYPEPDSSVEGGLLAKISSMYPHESIDIGEKLLPLPPDGTIPFLHEWKWIPTPGHSPGQIALFRERDRSLISGDAFITVRQDSFYKVLIQETEVNGPPRYLTTDWKRAYDSIVRLRELDPQLVIPGHGQMLEGIKLTTGLDNLINNFDELAKPDHGRFI